MKQTPKKYNLGLINTRKRKHIPTIHQSPEPTVGKMYYVICMTGTSYFSGEKLWLPILGRPHIDDRSVGTEDGTHFHVHVDMRFMTEHELQSMDWTTDTQGAWYVGSKEFQGTATYMKSYCRWEAREMKREFCYTPGPYRQGFTDKYLGRKDCRRCPHQGINLKQVPVQEHNGQQIKVCPGHRLIFDNNMECVG